MGIRLIPDDRKDQLIAAALVAATARGYTVINRYDVARLAHCTPGLVSHYFGSLADLRRTVLGEAIKRQVLPVVAQGLAMREDIPPHVAARAQEWMANNV